ncbi:hypothetical protein ACH4U6_35435 [Streptomyces netropsis]|uniref:hypothetical protein n=1 Tax=Streptomyces netropsis TaxID=55404 RepID=UPI00379F4823
MRIPRRLPATVAASTLLVGVLTYDAAAQAPQIITCDGASTTTFSPGVTTTPQDNVTRKTTGALWNCTGDPTATSATFVSEGVGNQVTCTQGTFRDKPGAVQRTSWQATAGELTSTFTWQMSPIGDLLEIQNPISGGITDGRYKGATWTTISDPARSVINITDCAKVGGLRSMRLGGRLVITLPN